MLYFDYNATTPLDEAVLEAMRPYFLSTFANASSLQHAPGRAAAAAVEEAAGRLAQRIGAEPRDLVFTSGATESNNLALVGAMRWWARQKVPRRHLVISAIEHASVLDVAAGLEREGVRVSRVMPGPDGRVSAADVSRHLGPDTALVSVMWANNETGVIQPVEEIGRICREKGLWFHSDATQVVGRLPVDLRQVPIDLMSFSAHKFYGPKGAGVLYGRRREPRVRLEPLIRGGGHQRGLRSGTLNVPGIVGLAAALDLACSRMAGEAVRLAELRDRLEAGLLKQLPMARRIGPAENRLFQTALVGLAGWDARSLMRHLPLLAVGHGAACSEPGLGTSHVLRAMGVSADLAAGALRFSLGRGSDVAGVDQAVAMLAQAVEKAPLDTAACRL